MKESFGIYKGEIVLDEDELEINDGIKPSRRYQTIALGVLGFALAVMFLLRYFKESETWYLAVFAIMVAMGIPGSFISYRMCFDTKIKYKDIKTVRIRDNFADQLVADIILHNRKRRQVILDQGKVNQFENLVMNHFVKTLSGKGIKVEFS